MDDNLKIAIQQMKNGEEKGFNAVYSATYNRVYFRAKQIMKKEEDAQDLTQIVFVEAYKNIGTLQAAEALYSWLDGITYNQGMKIFRKQREVLLTEEAEGLFDTIESNDISTIPELTADQKATVDIIKGIIEELPELQKAAVVAYYFDGLKVEQIANVMECSVNTIKSRLNYARKYIKERVEEKERKEGYRLHAFSLPTLWFAIKLIADNTTLTVQAAQNVYNGACASVGLPATALMGASGGVIAGTVSGAGAAYGAATAGTVAGEATKMAGLGAKFTSLSMMAKALIVAGAVAVAGLGTAGIVAVVNNQNKMVQENLSPEDDLSKYIYLYEDRDEDNKLYATKVSDKKYYFYAEDLEDCFDDNEEVCLVSDLPDHLGVSYVQFDFPITVTNPEKKINRHGDIEFELQTGHDIVVEIDYMDDIEYEESKDASNEKPVVQIQLTEEAQRQISAFVATCYSPSEVGNTITFSDYTPDDCFMKIFNYIWMVNFNFGDSTNPTDLPYDWVNNNVTEQEFIDFWKYGFGIEIPSDFSYSFEYDGGFIKLIDGKLQYSGDFTTVQVVGDKVEVISQSEENIVLSGTCYRNDTEKTNIRFIMYGTPSGNSEIFGGITINSIKLTEANAAEPEIKFNINLMAQKCVETMESLEAQGVYSKFDGYYVYDIDEDEIPEFILCHGTCNADYQYIIYKFQDSELVEMARLPWGGSLYGYTYEKLLDIKYTQMGEEIVYRYDTNTVEEISRRVVTENETEEEYVSGVNKLINYTEFDVESVSEKLSWYANIY